MNKKLVIIFIVFTISFHIFPNSAKEYWSEQAVLIEYNPIFHFSKGGGGNTELSFFTGFSIGCEFFYMNTDLFTPISHELLYSEKVQGWKLFIEPAWYILPSLKLFDINFKNNVVKDMFQSAMSGPYISFGVNLGYFDVYTNHPGYTGYFGAGISGKIGIRAIFSKYLIFNMYLGISGFFNNEVEIKKINSNEVVGFSNDEFFEYMRNPNPHFGLSIGFYLPFDQIINSYYGVNLWEN